MRGGLEPTLMSEQSRAAGGDDAVDGAHAASGGEGDAQESVASAEGGETSTAPAEPHDGTTEARIVGLESTDAEAVIGAVASDTARTVLDALYDEPSTASGLTDRVDCSLQTVQYHLGKLADADLIEVRGTATSEKGRKMDVYGPTRRPVVVYAGDDGGDDLRSMLARLVSGVAFLGLLSLLVQKLVGRERGKTIGTVGETGGAFSADAAESAGAAGGVEPGLLFFAGGLVVLVAYFGVWYLRRRGPLDGLRATA